MITPDGDNLAFILSTPRAGSTLLGAIMGSHPDVLCPPEPWFLLPLTGLRDGHLLVMAPYNHQLAQNAIHDVLPDNVLDRAISAFAITAYQSLLTDHGKRFFVDKTPPYYQILPSLDRLFPHAAQIWIRRNPLDVIASCKKSWGLSIHELMGHPVSPTAFGVTISFSLLAAHFREKNPRKICIKYEDLVRDPDVHIGSLCSFLGVPYDPTMLLYDENLDLMKSYKNSRVGDKNLVRSSGIHGQSINRWRKTLTPNEVRDILATLGANVFHSLGYEDQIEEAMTYGKVGRTEVTDDGEIPGLLQTFDRYAEAVIRQQASDPSREWLERRHAAMDELAAIVPEGESFVLVDDDQWATPNVIDGRRRISFLQRDGQYWGPPPDDVTAITEVQQLHRTGVGFIVFGWPAFWWLGYYSELHSHLRSTYRCVLDNDRLIMFDLRRRLRTTPVPGGGHAVTQSGARAVQGSPSR